MITGIHLGTIVGSEIKENREGEEDVRILSAEFTAGDDIQSVELVTQNGEQTNPNNDAMVVVLELGKAWKIAVAVRDNVEPDGALARGEKLIYALDSSNTIKASIRLKNDGTLVLNEGTDWAVQFTELKSAFDQLVTDFNNLVSVFNSHGHVYIPGPSGSATSAPTVTPGSSSTADMSNAKIESVKVP